MALCYKKLWHQLIDHDMTRSDLREAIGSHNPCEDVEGQGRGDANSRKDMQHPQLRHRRHCQLRPGTAHFAPRP